MEWQVKSAEGVIHTVCQVIDRVNQGAVQVEDDGFILVILSSYLNLSIFIITLLNAHFLCLPKENEPKEKAASHLVRLRRTTLRSSKRSGVWKLAALRQGQTPDSIIFAVLGCVKWHLYIPILFFWDPSCPAEHRSCWRIQTLDLFEPPKAVSFQRPGNNEKRKVSVADGQDSRGAFFLLLLLGK